MLYKKIIPCLDMKDGRVVKGVNFVNIVDAGDPVEAAIRYCEEGADELVFLDISATVEGRKTRIEMLKRAAKEVTVPLTIGGGISSVEDAEEVFAVGADKVGINSAAVKNKQLITDLAKRFGSRRVAVAIDVKKNEQDRYDVMIDGGMVSAGLDAVEWAKEAEQLGAGALLVTSMDADGARSGYDLDITGAIVKAVGIPVIASGGAGQLSDFKDAINVGASAVLAASLFHLGLIKIPDLKVYLMQQGIPVRFNKNTRIK